MSEEAWLEGHISVEAALAAGSREITAVYVQRNKWERSIRRLQQMAAAGNVPVERVTADFIAQKSGGQTHGGVIARVGPRRLRRLADLLPTDEIPFIVMLDGIEDPFNFGQAIRALYAAGAQGVVVRPRNWLSAAGVVARSSAGTSELMPMAVAETADDAADFYRAHGLTIACTAKQGRSCYDADLAQPLFLLIGGEKRGVTRSFREQAELHLTIPYGREFRYSLGATAATAVLAFEIARQRTQ